MSLSDEDAGMMDGLGETSLEHLGLEAALQEVLNLEAQHVIKLHLLLVQHSDPHETTEKCITWKKVRIHGIIKLLGKNVNMFCKA